jgi:hypothetical protein
MRNIENEDKYLEWKAKEAQTFNDLYKTDEVDIYYSPSIKYKLTVEYFHHQEGDYIHHSYSRGTISSMNNKTIIEIRRNISHFIHK